MLKFLQNYAKQPDGRRFYLGKRGDGGPVRFSYFLSLDDVMCNARSAVVFRRLPSQSARVLGDVRDREISAFAGHRCVQTHSQLLSPTRFFIRAENVM